MDTQIESVIRIVHILFGAIALFSGISALLLSPKIRLHRPAGKTFALAMVGVFFTAIILAVQNGIDFLFCIAILSFYSVIIGVRALKFLKGRKPAFFDWMASATLILAGFFLAAKGINAVMLTTLNGSVILYLLFGGAMVFYGSMTTSELLRTKPGSAKWFTLHKSNMGAALIATITAFSTTTMDFLPSILPWIWPSIVFSPLLSWYIRKSKKITVK